MGVSRQAYMTRRAAPHSSRWNHSHNQHPARPVLLVACRPQPLSARGGLNRLDARTNAGARDVALDAAAIIESLDDANLARTRLPVGRAHTYSPSAPALQWRTHVEILDLFNGKR